MTRYDILILGGDFIAKDIANLLPFTKLKIGVVLPVENEAIHLKNIIHFFKDGSPFETETSFPVPISVITGRPKFTGPKTIEVDGKFYSADKIIIATGARAHLPPIQGFKEVPVRPIEQFLMDESKPKSLIIVGANPLGVSLADYAADRKIDVTLMGNKHMVLSREEPEIAAAVTEYLSQKDVTMYPQVSFTHVKKDGKKISAVYEQDGVQSEVSAEELIFATGFVSQIDGLNLDIPGVFVNNEGCIEVNEESQTSCPWIYAAGSVTGVKNNLSLMSYQARLVSNNLTAPFFSKMRMEPEPVPFIIPLQRPVARVGLTEEEARREYKDVRVSITAGKDGLIKLVGRKKGARLLGAHIFSEHSEGTILFFNLMMRAGIPLNDLLDIHHYPPFTIAESVQQGIRSWMQGA